MNQAKKESLLLIECHPADARLITNALKNDGPNGLEVECIKKPSDGVERINKGKEGCSEGQGYFFCRPIIAEKFAKFLERGVTESVVH